jgi:type II secretory pathway component HofQ
MKAFRKIFIVVAVTVLFIGCATVKESKASPALIPLVQTPLLTKDQIKGLESKEVNEADSNYQALIYDENKQLATQPVVSNVFVETDVRAALTDIATQSGINIIPDLTVEGSVSVTLDKVHLETALKMLLYPGGYKFRYVKEGNYYLVGRTLPENSSFDALTITKVIKTNRNAEKVVSQISEHYKPYIQSGKDGNLITLNGPTDIVSRIERDIKLVDVSKRQIEISAKFVMIQYEKGSNMGMQWGNISLDATGLSNLIQGAISGTTATLNVGLSNFLSANGYDAKVNIVAEPRIVVEDGSEGEIKINEEHMFMILSGGGMAYNYFTTKEVSVGINMKVTPFVTRDGMIRMQLQPEISDIVGEDEFKTGGINQKTPIIARRSTTTIVKIDNGETIAIGGLVMKSKKTKDSGIPLLRHIPFLGKLIFGTKEKEDKDMELVVFITSKIIG